MKRITLLILSVLVLISCKNKSAEAIQEAVVVQKPEYQSFGKTIIPDDAIASSSMANHFESMQVGDSINSKMQAKVIEVCQAKGCWMTLNLENGNEVMVKFKDYGFFVPKDISGKAVIINGKAYVKEVSVDELRHYAEDAGKSEAEVAQITKPERTFSFEADGVLVIQ